jgi:hypothetical protein
MMRSDAGFRVLPTRLPRVGRGLHSDPVVVVLVHSRELRMAILARCADRVSTRYLHLFSLDSAGGHSELFLSHCYKASATAAAPIVFSVGLKLNETVC